MERRKRVPASAAIGQRFGRLVVISLSPIKSHNVIVNCICDCGNKYSPKLNNLRQGCIVSCGCWRQENSRRRFTTHGYCVNRKIPREYFVWQMMKDRCHNPKSTGYSNYGARGISVCTRWRDSFSAFIEDVGMRPSPKHEIERLNNDGNYEPRNCCWATRIEQQNNTRKSRRVEIDGIIKTISQWARGGSVSPETARSRIELGWSPSEAFGFTPRA